MAEVAEENKSSALVCELRDLYASERFQIGLLAFDSFTVLAFVGMTFLPTTGWSVAADAALGTLMLVEFVIRILIAHRRLAFLARPGSLLDAAIIASLLIPPLAGSFAFLRVMRALRLFRSLRVIREFTRCNRWVARHAELIGSAANLLVFILVTSAVVYEFQVGRNPDIRTISDALYFTVATLTTTGFGDITLTGDMGRLLSVVIMIVGISLFLKLAQAIVRPSKVHHECPVCGLTRHDPDAIHCKHCGTTLHIETEGA